MVVIAAMAAIVGWSGVARSWYDSTFVAVNGGVPAGSRHYDVWTEPLRVPALVALLVAGAGWVGARRRRADRVDGSDASSSARAEVRMLVLGSLVVGALVVAVALLTVGGLRARSASDPGAELSARLGGFTPPSGFEQVGTSEPSGAPDEGILQVFDHRGPGDLCAEVEVAFTRWAGAPPRRVDGNPCVLAGGDEQWVLHTNVSSVPGGHRLVVSVELRR